MSHPAAAVAFNATPISLRPDAHAPSVGARLLRLVSLRRGGPRDAREAYLAQSVDHRDLELRLRAWEAHVERMKSLTFAG